MCSSEAIVGHRGFDETPLQWVLVGPDASFGGTGRDRLGSIVTADAEPVLTEPVREPDLPRTTRTWH